MMGLDPGTEVPVGSGMGLHPEVAAVQELVRQGERFERRQDVLEANGWEEIKGFRDQVISQFRAANEEVAAHDPQEQMRQSRPVEMDPNLVADMRMKVVRVHNALRAAGIEEGVWNDPELARVAKVFSQDVSTTGIGYVESGDQPYQPAYKDAPVGLRELGWLSTEVVGPAVAAVAETGFNAGYGIAQLGAMAFEGLTGQDTSHTMPTVVIEDDNGNIVHNGGKLPSGMELIGAAYAAATGAELEGTMKSVGLAEQYANLRREGLDAVVAPVSSFVGSIAAFATPGGWAMAGGQGLVKNGLVRLAGAEKLAALSPWAKRLTSIVAGTSGAAFGNAMFMGVTYGHQEGYGHAMLEGAAITPTILALGAMGRGIERGLLARARMPKPVARAVSGAMEGAGFGMWQLATGDEAFRGEHELWDFMKDPTETKWEHWRSVMLENVLGMMIFKGAFGVTPGQYALDRMQGMPEAVTQARVRQEATQRQTERGARVVADRIHAERQPPPKIEKAAERPAEKPAGSDAGDDSPEVEISQGRRLFFEEVGPERQEWKVRDAEGKLIAGGAYTIEGGKARIWSAEVREEYQGQGIYTEVLQALKRRFPEGLESIDQTDAAQRAWIKAFGHVSRETIERLGEQVAAREAEGGPVTPAEQTTRARARAEGEGLYPEPPEAARERFYERVSAREEFPADRPAQVSPVEGTEPIHARDVISEGQVGPVRPGVLRRGLGVLKRWAKGYYSEREDLIRMEGSRDLNNFAHEWGHAFWGRHGEGMDLSPRAQSQLIEVGAPTSTPRMRADQRLHEGMAEFVARHFLGDRGLQERHPELFAEVMDYLARPEQTELLGQFQRLAAGFQRWRDQGALNRVRMAWVAHDEPMTPQQAQLELGEPVDRVGPLTRLRVGWRRAVASFEHAMVDDLGKLKREQRLALESAGIEDPNALPVVSNPARMMEILRGKSGSVLETFLFRHAIGFGGVGGRRGASLRDVLSEVKPEEREALTTYLIARRSLEALDRGLESQVSREDALVAVSELHNPRFERAAQELKGWFDNLIDYAVEAGALTGQSGDAIKGSWATYVPFFRALEGPRQVAPGRGVAERGTGVQRMRGETVEIRDPLEAALEVGQSIIQKAHQAAAMKAFWTLHLTTRGVGRFVTEEPRTVKRDTVTFEQLAEALDRQQFPGDVQHVAETFADSLRGLKVEDAEALITLFTQSSRPTGSKPVVAVVPHYTEAEIASLGFDAMPPTKGGYRTLGDQVRAENGKLKWMRLSNDTFEAVKEIDPATHLTHPILRALTAPAQAVKFGATVLNPAFTLRNIARDTLLNSLFTDVQNGQRLIPVVGACTNFCEGLSAQLRRDPQAELFRDIGGLQATFFGRELGSPSKQVQNPKTPQEAYRRVINALTTPEATLRIREFIGIREKALREGKSELEANLEALEAGQEISVNFIRAGTVGRVLNHWIPYLNAGVQGNRKFLRHVMGFEGAAKRNQAIAQGLANITLPSFMLWLMFKDEDWYQDLPAWRRNNYWTMPVPFTDELVSVPKPFEAGKIFGNIPEFLFNQGSGEPVALSEMGWDVVANFLNGFDFVPALLGPSIEAATNYSFFRRRELVPHWMEESRLPEDQYTSYTTETAKLLGRWFGIAPIKAEHWVSQHTGGLGLKVMRALDTFKSAPPDAKDTGVAIEDVPFVGTFFSQSPHKQGAFVQQIYDLDRELAQRSGSNQLTPAQAGFQPTLRAAKEMISNLKRQARAGTITFDEANRRAYEISRPIIEAYRKAQ